MAHLKFMTTVALGALVAGNAAFADVTPEQVWQSWQDLGASYGEVLAAESAVRNGDTLLVSGLTVTYEKDGGSFSASIDEVSFTDNGDGSVEITMSDSYPVSLVFPAPDAAYEPTGAELTGAELTVTQPGLTVTASGSAEETRYDVVAPSIKVALGEVQGGDADKPDLMVEIGLNAIEGNYIVSGTTDRTMSSTLSVQTTNLAIAANDPANSGKFSLTLALDALASTSTTKLIGTMDLQDLAAALAAGFASEGGLTYGRTDYSFDFADPTQTMASTGSFGSGNFDFAMDKTRMAFGAISKDAVITTSGSTIPFPEVVVQYAVSAFNMVMPLSKSDTPAEFSLLTKLVDLTISDDVWAMFDPAATLPRDAVTVVLDAKGTGTLIVDLTDTAALEALGANPPGVLNSFELTDLTLKAVGVTATGTGAATFDNTDLVTYGGMPAPTGAVELKVVGANGLMDKLVAMGLLPADQVSGFRMMLGMFANAVEGEADTMTSKIEFKDKGIFANGMQLQ